MHLSLLGHLLRSPAIPRMILVLARRCRATFVRTSKKSQTGSSPLDSLLVYFSTRTFEESSSCQSLRQVCGLPKVARRASSIHRM
ncbi:hypothetical protein BC939DRAFT_35287 [Gamsiella multidivaricata]|uniref:uncharacterized protein n=1 Tax=Gamsiella multidivaricata TaxID=101098 RepID=UPI00222100B3|nr:uncharacterized protein BC939DRAFT_35287 [Gamsiella multidivaricata]KAI7816631.1 hypothetical protein BC939DRAFT_35287 [Gamsiella multidivaricata]